MNEELLARIQELMESDPNRFTRAVIDSLLVEDGRFDSLAALERDVANSPETRRAAALEASEAGFGEAQGPPTEASFTPRDDNALLRLGDFLGDVLDPNRNLDKFRDMATAAVDSRTFGLLPEGVEGLLSSPGTPIGLVGRLSPETPGRVADAVDARIETARDRLPAGQEMTADIVGGIGTLFGPGGLVRTASRTGGTVMGSTPAARGIRSFGRTSDEAVGAIGAESRRLRELASSALVRPSQVGLNEGRRAVLRNALGGVTAAGLQEAGHTDGGVGERARAFGEAAVDAGPASVLLGVGAGVARGGIASSRMRRIIEDNPVPRIEQSLRQRGTATTLTDALRDPRTGRVVVGAANRPSLTASGILGRLDDRAASAANATTRDSAERFAKIIRSGKAAGRARLDDFHEATLKLSGDEAQAFRIGVFTDIADDIAGRTSSAREPLKLASDQLTKLRFVFDVGEHNPQGTELFNQFLGTLTIENKIQRNAAIREAVTKWVSLGLGGSSVLAGAIGLFN